MPIFGIKDIGLEKQHKPYKTVQDLYYTTSLLSVTTDFKKQNTCSVMVKVLQL